jgi:hypothetical protein
MNSMNAKRMTCTRNDGYPASLKVDKVYESQLDEAAAKHGLVRIIDDSGEDYLYPETYFTPAGAADGAQSQPQKAVQRDP